MAVKVVNILKDGTIVDDMSKVTVPDELVKKIAETYIRTMRGGTSERTGKKR